jgi:chemotaxis methyl-accepting protein methylase
LRIKIDHDFSKYKEATVARRVQRRMQVLQIAKVPSYIERLRNDPKEAELLFRELLIGVTQFFRDPDAFAALQERAIAKIVQEKDPTKPFAFGSRAARLAKRCIQSRSSSGRRWNGKAARPGFKSLGPILTRTP